MFDEQRLELMLGKGLAALTPSIGLIGILEELYR